MKQWGAKKEGFRDCSVTIDVRLKVKKKARESVRIELPHTKLTGDSNAMNSITQNKRYLPHEMSTKINSVKLYRQTCDCPLWLRTSYDPDG